MVFTLKPPFSHGFPIKTSIFLRDYASNFLVTWSFPCDIDHSARTPWVSPWRWRMDSWIAWRRRDFRRRGAMENHRKMMENGGLPSGKHTKSYWKWPFIVDFHWIFIYVAVSWNGYGSITVHTIFRGMNIHKSQLFWCELQGYKVLTHCQMVVPQNHGF